MSSISMIKVTLWGHVVGYIADDSGVITFEYEEEFKNKNYEISPNELPLATTTQFQQTNPSVTFRGLPGVIADCLPDNFGAKVIKNFYTSEMGLAPQQISVLNYLSYIGKTSLGALEFTPEESEGETFSVEVLKISLLKEEARKTLDGKMNKKTSDIMRISGSAGGMRAKAHIDFNPQTNEMRSGLNKSEEGFIPSIIKFDGVSDDGEYGVDGLVEYIYNLIAASCGIQTTLCHIFKENEDGRDLIHFVTERFDRTPEGDKPFHYLSLCGFDSADFRDKHYYSYEEYFQAAMMLTNDHSAVKQAFKRATFNIIMRNQDDHTKNFGFIMNKEGTWFLAPAFDLTYSYSSGVNVTHQMLFNGKDDGFTIDDFIDVGEKFNIKRKDVLKIVKEVQAASESFKEVAHSFGMEDQYIESITMNLRKIVS